MSAFTTFITVLIIIYMIVIIIGCFTGGFKKKGKDGVSITETHVFEPSREPQRELPRLHQRRKRTTVYVKKEDLNFAVNALIDVQGIKIKVKNTKNTQPAVSGNTPNPSAVIEKPQEEAVVKEASKNEAPKNEEATTEEELLKDLEEAEDSVSE